MFGRFLIVIFILCAWLRLGYAAEPFTGTEVSASFSQIVDGTAQPQLNVRVANYMSDFAVGAFATTEENFGPAFIWRVFQTHFTEKRNIGVAFHVAANSDLWQGGQLESKANLIYQVEPRLLWATLDDALELGIPITYATREGDEAVWGFGLTLNFHPSKR
jgi:hypothetical protein